MVDETSVMPTPFRPIWVAIWPYADSGAPPAPTPIPPAPPAPTHPPRHRTGQNWGGCCVDGCPPGPAARASEGRARRVSPTATRVRLAVYAPAGNAVGVFCVGGTAPCQILFWRIGLWLVRLVLTCRRFQALPKQDIRDQRQPCQSVGRHCADIGDGGGHSLRTGHGRLGPVDCCDLPCRGEPEQGHQKDQWQRRIECPCRQPQAHGQGDVSACHG